MIATKTPFLKDPLFFADSLFVENPERIETMLFLMSLCLLVYNLGQRELRNSLKRIKIGIKNQLGKLTISPTLRWVFQCFQGIHLLTLNGVNQIVNLTLERSFILNCLPSSCLKYYLLSESEQLLESEEKFINIEETVIALQIFSAYITIKYIVFDDLFSCCRFVQHYES